MKPYNIYFYELVIRSLYIFFSYCICLVILFLNIEILFLFEIYPFMNITNNRFISTRLTDFVDVVWTLSAFMSTLFVLPLFVYHINSFFYNSWYTYQINFFKKLIRISIISFLITYFIIHNNLLSSIFTFFLYWEITEESSLLRIEAETTILSYMNWILFFKSLFSFLFSLGLFNLLILLNFIKIKYIHKYFKLYKNIFIYLFIFLSFLITPPDLFLQLFIILFNLILFNLILFILCIQFYKTNVKVYKKL
nr:preprotein translocase subunit SecY [Lithothamnion corallioides]